MALHRKSFILTLVLTGLITTLTALSVWASPSTDFEANKISPKDTLKNEPVDLITKTRPFSKVAETVALGYISGPIINFDESKVSYNLSYTKSFYSGAKGEEWQLLVMPTGQFGWTLDYKWLLTFNEWNEPYYRFGFGAIYLPSESLGTLINWKRYNLQFGYGFEDLFDNQRQLRGELTLIWSGLGLLGQITLGTTF